MKRQYFLAAMLAVTLSACENSSNTTTTTRDNQLESNKSEKTRDLRITQQIRKSIIGDRNLSSDARNVKIITVDGRVSLRGAVNDLREKNKILDYVNQTADVTDIDDQLRIKR